MSLVALSLPLAVVSYDYLRLFATAAALFGFQVYGIESVYALRTGIGPIGQSPYGDRLFKRQMCFRLVFGVGFLLTPLPLYL